MIKKQLKKKTHNFLLDVLFKSKNFYGETIEKTNKNTLPFIYGIRHNYSIINLKYTSIFLKRIFKLIKYIIKKKKKILIIGNSNEIKFLMNQNFIKKNLNIILYNQDWINGIITNNNIKTFFNKNDIKFVLILKNTVKDEFLKKELSILQIPIISFLNTNQNINNINYPIITNSKNIKSLYILIYLIRKLF